MLKTKNDEIVHDHNDDGIDRRGFLKCMAWAGTGALCVMEGGILAIEFLAFGLVTLTAHLGGFLSGVNGPG